MAKRHGLAKSFPDTVSFPVPSLEGFVIIVQHGPDVAPCPEAALAHAGATVFVARLAWETVHLRKKYDAQLVVFDSHDPDGGEPVVVDARMMAHAGAIRYSKEVADLSGHDIVWDADRRRASGGGRRCSGYRVAAPAKNMN
ncbi:hypothetical protein SB748_13110 [Rhizobium sp. SIMBA_035]